MNENGWRPAPHPLVYVILAAFLSWSVVDAAQQGDWIDVVKYPLIGASFVLGRIPWKSATAGERAAIVAVMAGLLVNLAMDVANWPAAWTS